MQTATLNKNGQISIPAEIRQKLGLTTGDTLQFEWAGQKIILEPVEIIPRSQLYYHQKDFQRSLSKARQEVRVKKNLSFDNSKNAIKWLKSSK